MMRAREDHIRGRNTMLRRDAIIRCPCRTIVAAGFFLLSLPALYGQTSTGGETIVMLRHGEKPAGGLGQLSCKGLNRALSAIRAH